MDLWRLLRVSILSEANCVVQWLTLIMQNIDLFPAPLRKTVRYLVAQDCAVCRPWDLLYWVASSVSRAKCHTAHSIQSLDWSRRWRINDRRSDDCQ
jgi:hypothetical protein